MCSLNKQEKAVKEVYSLLFANYLSYVNSSVIHMGDACGSSKWG